MRRRLLAATLAMLGQAAGTRLAAAPAGSRSKSPPIVTILGDSITAGLGLAAADALPARLEQALASLGVRATVRGAGVSGDTSAGGLARVDFSVLPDTAVCVVELGANDFLQSVDPAETRRNLAGIVRRLKARRIRVVLARGAVPSRTSGSFGRDFAAMYEQVARDERVALTPDLLGGVLGHSALEQADGLHPNATGVRILAGRLAPSVARALGRP